MIDFKIDSRIAGTIYEAVHLAGGGAWKENADVKAKGEKRILKSLPDDPRITWSEWRARPEVFENQTCSRGADCQRFAGEVRQIAQDHLGVLWFAIG